MTIPRDRPRFVRGPTLAPNAGIEHHPSILPQSSPPTLREMQRVQMMTAGRHCFGPIALALALAGAARADEPGKVYTQEPEVVPSQLRDAKPAADAGPTAEQKALKEGPAASWIWGENQDRRYFIRKGFEAKGKAKAAWLKAAADNKITVFVNDRNVGTSDDWNEPIEVEITDSLKPGQNVIAIDVSNSGGPAAAALKLALTNEDGTVDYIVTDESWMASANRRSRDAQPVHVIGKMGSTLPWGDVFAKESRFAGATRGVFQVLPGFQVERLFTVPRDELGSWVAIAFDPKGRLIASDQENKGLCRITVPAPGSDDPVRVERLSVPITSAQGMLFAFDSFYVTVNGGPGSGLYRVRDTNGDDQYDEVVKLKEIRGGGEHGPHALRLSPDGKSIYLMSGNHTLPPDNPSPNSPVPLNWQEDLLLPRQWDANGHAVGIMAPGGWVARTDPDGKEWEVTSIGYRNAYDMDFNADGELFAYDSDMEWDMGMPWYRPTRVNHATSGSEFGWRSGTGVWPAYFIDSLPPMIDTGPGSPVGVTFGYGAKFPAAYQKALFICDWTFGTIYALHLKPNGSTYGATKEEFLSRTPLPLTDTAVGPDGALYFTIGGRGTQSELYRVRYVGDEPTAPVDAKDAEGAEARALRHQIEQYHRRADDQAKAVAFVWPHLKSGDRFLSTAARIALEHQDPATWQDRVFSEADPEALLNAAVALAHQGDKSLQPKLIAALDKLDFASLSPAQKLGLLRAWGLTFIRMGAPDAETAKKIAAKLDGYYPAANDDILNRELCNLLVYLQSPTVLAKTIALMKQDTKKPEIDKATADLLARNAGYGGPIAKMLENRPDAQKIHYAFALRNVKEGWSLEDRKFYFQFLEKAREWSGGASYLGFLKNIDKDAFENASEADRLAIESTGARQPFRVKELPKAQGPGHKWTLEEVIDLTSKEPIRGRNYERGRTAFAAAQCVLCHRFVGDGGATGPDLTQAAGRFGAKEIAEAILEPSKVISDQYRASIVATAEGQVLNGRIVSETPEKLVILVDPADSTKIVEVKRNDVEEVRPSPVSVMPEELLNTLNPDEVLDLFAYLLSRGNPDDPMFRKK